MESALEEVPRLSRKWRIVRNLGAAALLFLLVPLTQGWPSWSVYGAFRQLEAQCLLTPSELVLQVGDGKTRAYLTEGESWVTVGTALQMNIDSRRRNEAYLHYVLPKEGLVVTALPVAAEEYTMVVAVWGGPEEAVSGVLELDIKQDGERDWNPIPEVYILKDQETFTAEARREENGWFFFYLKPHRLTENNVYYEGETEELCLMEAMWLDRFVFFAHGMEEWPYRLTLLDEAGNQVERKESTLPPEQYIWDYF